MMTADEFIDAALDQGHKEGLQSLQEVARQVVVIANLEHITQMNGIDTFIDLYGLEGISEAAEAHRAIGAYELADALQRVVETKGTDEDALNLAHQLAGAVHGYSYESIAAYVAKAMNL